MKQTWEELHSRFGFNLKGWKKEFNDYMGMQRRNVSETEGFLVFGNDRINPILNTLLCRRLGHPTFNKLVEYVVKK